MSELRVIPLEGYGEVSEQERDPVYGMNWILHLPWSDERFYGTKAEAVARAKATIRRVEAQEREEEGG